MMSGKEIRMDRLIDRRSGKTVIVPMDHGVTAGPIAGLTRLEATIRAVARGGANAIVIHKGGAKQGCLRNGQKLGLLVHLSASTRMAPDPLSKALVCTVEEAIKLGADGISVHVNLGAVEEQSMIRDLALVSRKAMEWGMPLLAMMYTRGPNIVNEYDSNMVKHAARVAAELGADIVKVPYTGSPESFREVVEGCFVPVVIAGGEKMGTERELLEMVKGAMGAGGAGVSIGRNVFQHPTPSFLVKAISKVVHDGASVEEGLSELENEP